MPGARLEACKSEQPLAVGANTDVALLSPGGAGTYTVVRIIRTERLLGARQGAAPLAQQAEVGKAGAR